MSAPFLLTASHHRIRLLIALQDYKRKGGLQMSKNQYDAPAMEVVEFGKEDIVCVISGYDVVTPGGEHVGGGGIGEWSPDLPWGGN